VALNAQDNCSKSVWSTVHDVLSEEHAFHVHNVPYNDCQRSLLCQWSLLCGAVIECNWSAKFS